MRTAWSSPVSSGGWPTFDSDGQVIKDTLQCCDEHDEYELCRAPGEDGACVKMCGRKCMWANTPVTGCPRCGGSGMVSLGEGVRGIGRCPRCRP